MALGTRVRSGDGPNPASTMPADCSASWRLAVAVPRSRDGCRTTEAAGWFARIDPRDGLVERGPGAQFVVHGRGAVVRPAPLLRGSSTDGFRNHRGSNEQPQCAFKDAARQRSGGCYRSSGVEVTDGRLWKNCGSTRPRPVRSRGSAGDRRRGTARPAGSECGSAWSTPAAQVRLGHPTSTAGQRERTQSSTAPQTAAPRTGVCGVWAGRRRGLQVRILADESVVGGPRAGWDLMVHDLAPPA